MECNKQIQCSVKYKKYVSRQYARVIIFLHMMIIIEAEILSDKRFHTFAVSNNIICLH